jgi:hypothetical protein
MSKLDQAAHDAFRQRLVVQSAADRAHQRRRIVEERRDTGAPSEFPILAEVAVNDGGRPAPGIPAVPGNTGETEPT